MRDHKKSYNHLLLHSIKKDLLIAEFISGYIKSSNFSLYKLSAFRLLDIMEQFLKQLLRDKLLEKYPKLLNIK